MRSRERAGARADRLGRRAVGVVASMATGARHGSSTEIRVSNTFSPEEVLIVRKAFLLARKTYNRRPSKTENDLLAKTVVGLAADGCLDVEILALRTVIRAF
jgi:hypothetical protein